MKKINENFLSSLLLENIASRLVEPNIYSVFQENGPGNEYDTKFGFIYDWIACNPIYNRYIWGYSIKIFSKIASDALRSSKEGNVLDLGCGSLAFTANTYSQYSERPVILVDQSLKMLRIGKSRLIKQNGKVPENIIFLHADAQQLPFKDKTFKTIHCQNLLHCLSDTSIFLKSLEHLLYQSGNMYFTTLVKTNRYADKYLEALAQKDKLVSRTVDDHKAVFEQLGLSVKYEMNGNMLSIFYEK